MSASASFLRRSRYRIPPPPNRTPTTPRLCRWRGILKKLLPISLLPKLALAGYKCCCSGCTPLAGFEFIIGRFADVHRGYQEVKE